MASIMIQPEKIASVKRRMIDGGHEWSAVTTGGDVVIYRHLTNPRTLGLELQVVLGTVVWAHDTASIDPELAGEFAAMLAVLGRIHDRQRADAAAAAREGLAARAAELFG